MGEQRRFASVAWSQKRKDNAPGAISRRDGRGDTVEAVAGVDPGMKQAMKGKAWYFGMKLHVGTDRKGRVHHVTASLPRAETALHSARNVHNSAQSTPAER